MRMGKVDYPGYHLHGRTLPVVREGRHSIWGVDLVTVQDGWALFALPAARVRVFDAPDREAAE